MGYSKLLITFLKKYHTNLWCDGCNFLSMVKDLMSDDSDDGDTWSWFSLVLICTFGRVILVKSIIPFISHLGSWSVFVICYFIFSIFSIILAAPQMQQGSLKMSTSEWGLSLFDMISLWSYQLGHHQSCL